MESKSSFSVTPAIQEMEKRVLGITRLSRTMYHRLALERYLGQENPQINYRLLIKKKTDPEYVRKNAVEPVYLSEEHRAGLDRIAQQYDTNIGTVFLQALLEYTVIQAELLGLSDSIK